MIYSAEDLMNVFGTLVPDFGLADPAGRRLCGVVRAIDLAGEAQERGEEDGGMPAEARAVKDVLDGMIKISATDAELLERAAPALRAKRSPSSRPTRSAISPTSSVCSRSPSSSARRKDSLQLPR